jgi:hypothetical protein
MFIAVFTRMYGSWAREASARQGKGSLDPLYLLGNRSNTAIRAAWGAKEELATALLGFYTDRARSPYRTYAFARNDQLGKRNYLSK